MSITFQGEQISVARAREIIIELSEAIAATEPDLSESPVGKPIKALVDPRWYSEFSAQFPGSLLSFRSPSLGWLGFLLPWQEVAKLVGLLVQQLASAAQHDSETHNQRIH